MPEEKEKEELPPLVVRNVPPKLKQDLINIARNQGQTLSGFLKPHLRKIRDSYPEKERVWEDD